MMASGPARRHDYFKLYRVTAEAIKSVSPDYRVGGPATAMGQWDRSFIDFCHSNNVPLDFVSTPCLWRQGGVFWMKPASAER